MQAVQFSPFLIFLGHSVSIVQYKLVEQIKKENLMSVPQGCILTLVKNPKPV